VKRASSTAGHLCRTLAVWAVLVGAGMPAAAQQSGAAIVQPPGAAAGTAVSAAEYRLGAGDVIRIAVFQNPDLTLETRVTESGLVSYPLLGNIRLGGQSVTQAEALIADGLRSGNFVRQAQVTITVLQVRGHQASVLGQVNRPGRFPLETGDVRLTDLLAMAGGTGPNGSDVLVVTGVRDGQPFRREVDLPTLFAAGGHERNLLIRNGDVVWVDRQPQVYIYGEVQRPGPMRLERGMTLMQALATGGGLTQRGTEKGIRVHRRDPDGAVRVVTPGMDDRVQDGDVVYVRESLF
jgi:polysaccharide biosynthesis/export protein